MFEFEDSNEWTPEELARMGTIDGAGKTIVPELTYEDLGLDPETDCVCDNCVAAVLKVYNREGN